MGHTVLLHGVFNPEFEYICLQRRPKAPGTETPGCRETSAGQPKRKNSPRQANRVGGSAPLPSIRTAWRAAAPQEGRGPFKARGRHGPAPPRPARPRAAVARQ